MSNKISGFHVCKPANAPTVGQTKTFTVNGDRIRSKSAQDGGQSYNVVSVAPRESYKDSYGNSGYDIEIEPQNGSQASKDATQSAGNSGWSDNRSNRIERQHSQSVAIEYWTLLASGGGITPEDCKDTKKLRAMIDWFERDIDHSVKLIKSNPDEESF